LSSRTLVLVGVVAVLLLGATFGSLDFVRSGAAKPAPVAKSTPTPAQSPEPASTPRPTPTPAGYDHIVVIVLENHSFESVIGSPEAPYLNGFASQWALATGYSGVSHPSLPNYLAMIGGSTFGVTSDCTDCIVNAPSLPDRLEAAGKTWKGYLEGMPSPCYLGSSGLYAQKHNPFIYFDPIRTNPSRCAQVVPYGNLAGDFSSPATAPNFAFVTPNLCNDGHDCRLSTTDAWLSREVPALMASPAFSASRSLLVITYDEGEGGSDRVATVLAGSGVRIGFQTPTTYNHYSLLRTIEDLWGLAPLAAGDGSAAPMTEFLGA
jgi:phosphatidylinositol-3-phosphatase